MAMTGRLVMGLFSFATTRFARLSSMYLQLAFHQFMYNRLLFCCPPALADGIFASVSKQCPQGPAHLGNSSHLNVAEFEGFELLNKELFLKLSNGIRKFLKRGRSQAAVSVVVGASVQRIQRTYPFGR